MLQTFRKLALQKIASEVTRTYTGIVLVDKDCARVGALTNRGNIMATLSSLRVPVSILMSVIFAKKLHSAISLYHVIVGVVGGVCSCAELCDVIYLSK